MEIDPLPRYDQKNVSSIMGMLEDWIISFQLTFPPIVFKLDDLMLSDKGYLYANGRVKSDGRVKYKQNKQVTSLK